MVAAIDLYSRLAEARSHILAEQPDGALAVLVPILGEEPEHLEARHLQLLALYQKLYGAVALEAMNGLTSLHQEIHEAHLRMAQTLREGGADEAADFAFRTVALLDYRLRPQLTAGFGGAFNGQVLRRACFDAIAASGTLAEVAETGTHRGSTTEYMAERVTCPIRTVELSPYYTEFSRLRFADLEKKGFAWAGNIDLHQADSRSFLAKILGEPEPAAGFSFFYLDAHGEYIFETDGPENPLTIEVAQIRRGRRHAIIMIDDFAIDDDPGYFQDPKNNTLADLATILPEFDDWFLPISSQHESGFFRGSLVLSGSPETSALLASIAVLRRAR